MSLERPCIHWNDGYCKRFSNGEVVSWCVDGPCEYEQPSNADRIRAMSDEALADLLSKFCENADDCGLCPLLGRCPIVYFNISNDTTKDFEEWLGLEARL